MRVLYILITIFSLNVYANEQFTLICQEEGRKFGDGTGVDLISAECMDHFFQQAAANAVKENEDKSWMLFGYQNIIFSKLATAEGFHTDVISGSSTTLDSVIAVAQDAVNNEIVVLQKNGDILFYSSIITGNVAPYHMLRAKQLAGAHDMVINSATQEIIVANKKEGSILFFSRQANFFAPVGRQNLALLRSIEGLSSGIESIDVDKKSGELFVVDSVNNQILTFDLNSSTDTPKRVIKGNKTQLKDPYFVQFLSDQNKLLIKNRDGESTTFSSSATGNISPLTE